MNGRSFFWVELLIDSFNLVFFTLWLLLYLFLYLLNHFWMVWNILEAYTVWHFHFHCLLNCFFHVLIQTVSLPLCVDWMDWPSWERSFRNYFIPVSWVFSAFLLRWFLDFLKDSHYFSNCEFCSWEWNPISIFDNELLKLLWKLLWVVSLLTLYLF
jgi:hypothetical protein